MIPIQPVGWSSYLTLKAEPLKKELSHFFYLSWEDAVWDLVKYFAYPKGSVVLLPEFYCADVVSNMEAHGLRYVTYPVDQNFQTSAKVFQQFLLKYKPQIVIIFHAVGITNKLMYQTKSWSAVLPKDCLLIEDAVHRIVEPNKLEFLTDRHVVIDSLRKVAPIQGSNLYGTVILKDLKQTKVFSTFYYRLKVVYWWLLLQIYLSLVKLLPGKRWQFFWNKLAEKAMLKGYEIIGDSQLAGHGLIFFEKLSKHLNYQKITKTKVNQVKQYETLLKPLWQSTKVFKINIDREDYGKLRAFPVGLKLTKASAILKKLRASGLLVRFELDNFGWSKKHKVIYLPLGPHLNEKNISWVATILKKTI